MVSSRSWLIISSGYLALSRRRWYPILPPDVDKVDAVGRAIVGQGYYAEPVAVAGNGSDFLEEIRVLQVLFRPGEEVEVGRHGVVEVEPAVGVGPGFCSGRKSGRAW